MTTDPPQTLPKRPLPPPSVFNTNVSLVPMTFSAATADIQRAKTPPPRSDRGCWVDFCGDGMGVGLLGDDVEAHGGRGDIGRMIFVGVGWLMHEKCHVCALVHSCVRGCARAFGCDIAVCRCVHR